MTKTAALKEIIEQYTSGECLTKETAERLNKAMAELGLNSRERRDVFELVGYIMPDGTRLVPDCNLWHFGVV